MKASVVAAHGLSCSEACGILLDKGLNLCLLKWQMDSLPLSHQGSPDLELLDLQNYIFVSFLFRFLIGIIQFFPPGSVS